MGEMTSRFKDKDHVTESWRHTEKGKKSPTLSVFELTRMK